MNRDRDLAHRYGPWALVAGASEGLGAAYARELATGGFNLVLVARREKELVETAQMLESTHGIRVRTVRGDLGTPETIDRVVSACSEIDVGLVVYNAALAPAGRFATTDTDALEGAAGVNVLGPLRLIRRLLPTMLTRTRSGIVLMSSIAGLVGSPGLATYSATKAFTTALGHALSEELREQGVDVTVCVAGAVRTPGLEQASRGSGVREAPGTLDPRNVARVALRALGRKPVVVPGFTNKLARFVMVRVLSVRSALRIIRTQTERAGVSGSSRAEAADPEGRE